MHRKYRILELCLSDGQGGLELYVVKIIGQLRARGHTVYSITRNETFLCSALHSEWNKCLERPALINLLRHAKHIARSIEHNKIDILRINWGHDLLLACMVKYLCRWPVKLIYSRHMRITRSKKDLYHRILYRKVDFFTATTGNLLQEAEQFLPMNPSDMALLYIGITPVVGTRDCKKFLSDVELNLGIFTVGCFSRIEQAKGQHILVDALQVLRSNNVQFQALIIGYVMDAEYFNELQSRVAKYGLQNQIRFMPFLEQPMKIMPCFDVVVLPTFEETFGLVLAEAMNMGVAVMGTDAGGVPEIIEHEVSGLLFEPGNHQALAHGLERLYKDPAYRDKLANFGKIKTQKNFTDRAHLDRLEGIFQSVCASS